MAAISSRFFQALIARSPRWGLLRRRAKRLPQHEDETFVLLHEVQGGLIAQATTATCVQARVLQIGLLVNIGIFLVEYVKQPNNSRFANSLPGHCWGVRRT